MGATDQARDKADILTEIFRARFGAEASCPKCRLKTKWHRFRAERAFACQRCGHHVHPTVGTLMEKTRLPLTKWFQAAEACCHGNLDTGKLADQIEVNEKTALRMMSLLICAHEILCGGRKRGRRASFPPIELLLVPRKDAELLGAKSAERLTRRKRSHYAKKPRELELGSFVFEPMTLDLGDLKNLFKGPLFPDGWKMERPKRRKNKS